MTKPRGRAKDTKIFESPQLQVQRTTPVSKLIQFLRIVIAGINPFSLVASIFPVLITSALHHSAYGSKRAPLFSTELVLALIIAMSFQAIGNLNNVYLTFQQLLHSSQKASNDRKIVINLLSKLQIRRLSYALLTVIFISFLFHWKLQQNTKSSVYFVIVSLVIFYFLTNPNESSSRRPGVEEFLQAFTFGPMLMCSSSIFLLEKKLNLAAVAVAVPFYSIVVFMYFVAFLIAQSARHAAAKDRRLGGGKNCSLALYLGFEKSYRLLILFMGFFLGMYAMLAFAHHPGMLLLLVVVAKQFKAVGDHFRQEQIEQIPSNMARLGVFLAIGTYLAILFT